MADYWIKLYHEILDDPKMAVLPDRLWRRVIELFLMAGRMQKAGELPDTNQIAWMLRMPTDDLEMDLKQIALTGIIERKVNGWLIVKFAERQAKVSDVERKRQQRDRDHKKDYYGNEDVTNLSRSVTQITDNRSETETETYSESDLDPFDNMKALCENLTGRLMIQSDISTINKFIEQGIIEADIANAIKWWTDTGKVITRIGQLENSVLYQKGQRIQTLTGGVNGGEKQNTMIGDGGVHV